MPAAPATLPIPPSASVSTTAVWLSPAPIDPPRRQLPYVFSPSPQAGFASPAADFVEEALDLHEHLVSNPASTVFVRAQGESMVDAGILDGSILVVDRSVEARTGRIVVAAVNGDLLVKRYRAHGQKAWLCSENAAHSERFPPIDLEKVEDVIIWGVVTATIKRF